jgi:PAS domain-containing protein
VEGSQKNLALILARELASKLATAMFIADAEGDVVFYNEPAEEILSRTSAEVAASEDLQPVKTHAGGLRAEKRAPART